MAEETPVRRTKINLKDFEKKVRVRKLRLKDHDEVVKLQLTCFPKMKPWTKEQFESMLKIFPQGQLCVEFNGKIVASSSSLVLEFEEYQDWHDWRLISDSGYIRNHDPEGDSLYGIEIMVDPKFRGMRLARRLYEARKRLCKEMNLQRIVIGGRIPGYNKYRTKMTAEQYVEKVRRNEIYDMVLTTQLANGFHLRNLIAEYLPSDEDSAGYATHMDWINLDYQPDEKAWLATPPVARICTVQWRMRPVQNFAQFAQQVTFYVDTASDDRADFVLFPELFTLQLLSFTPTKRPGEAARKLSEFTPQYIELFSRLAVKYNVNIIGGSHFTLEDDHLRNIAYLFRRDGSLAKQDKLHVTPSERKWWGVEGGDRVEVFDTDRGKIGILVCYDIEFPELVRVAVQKGARIIFCPFNTDNEHGYLRIRCCAQARCVENHVYVAIAGCTGNLPLVENADIHYAQSGIFTPCDYAFSRGGIGAECNPNIETIVTHDVNLDTLRRHRFTGSTRNWNDRRTDLYNVSYQDPEGKLKI